MSNGEDEKDWLDDLCDYTGYESALPVGILAPSRVCIIPRKRCALVLTKSRLEGTSEKLVEVDEKAYQEAIELNPKGIQIEMSNEGTMTREEYIRKYDRDPLVVLGWMRRNPGVWTPKGQVIQGGGIVSGEPIDKPKTVKIGGKGGITTPSQAPRKKY